MPGGCLARNWRNPLRPFAAVTGPLIRGLVLAVPENIPGFTALEADQI